MTTSTAWTVFFPGPSMHRTPYGRPPRDSPRSSAYSATNLLFPWTGEPSDVPAVDHWFLVSERFWDSAHVHLQQAVRRHKHFADACRSHAPVYCPGDQVWLPTQDLRLRLPCRKLNACFIGPFTIERQINGHLSLSTPSPVSYSPCIPCLTSHFSSPSLPLSQAPKNWQYHLLPNFKRNPPSTKYERSWTPVDRPATWNIRSTGRVTGRRKDPGWPSMMFWIPLFSPISFTATNWLNLKSLYFTILKVYNI